MRLKIARIAVLLAAIAALSGCQAFFTTSIASSLARDTVTVPADISNADAAAILAGDPSDAMLAGLLEVLNDQAAAGDTGAASLAAEAAISVSGVSDTIMETASEWIATESLPSDLSSFVDAIEAGYGESGVSTALLALSDPAAAAGLEPTQLLVAAVLLATSALDAYTVDISDPEHPTGDLAAYKTDAAVVLALKLAGDAASALPADSAGAQLADKLAALFPME